MDILLRPLCDRYNNTNLVKGRSELRKLIIVIVLLATLYFTACAPEPLKGGQVIAKRFQSAHDYQPSICEVTIQNGDVTRTVYVTPSEFINIGIGNWLVVD